MARKGSDRGRQLLQALADEDRDWLKEIVRATVQEVLQAEMQQFLAAASYERTAKRRGYWSRLSFAQAHQTSRHDITSRTRGPGVQREAAGAAIRRLC